MTDALTTPSIAPLLEAGAVLATLAEPGRDLAETGSDVAEIGETLRLLGKGMQRAYERGEEHHWKIIDGRQDSRRWDDADEARGLEIAAARATALRTARRALVDLASLIGELEDQP